MRKEMLKNGDKMYRGGKLEEGMRGLKSGRGVTSSEAVKVQVGDVDGPKEGFSALPALAPGQGWGRQKKGGCAQMEPDVAHVMWAVAGMGTVATGHTTVARKD